MHNINYKELNSHYKHLKKQETESDEWLEYRINALENLILEKETEYKKKSLFRQLIAWLVSSLCVLFVFLRIANIDSVLGIFSILLISIIIGALFIFVLVLGVSDLIFFKNIHDLQEIELLKFEWLVLGNEFDRRK